MATQRKRSAETWRHVLTRDLGLPPEEQTTFVLRPLTQVERAEARDNLARIHALPDGATATVTRTHRLSLDLVLSNTVAVENFRNDKGVVLPWPEERDARLVYLDGLEDEDVKEVGNEIWVHSTLGGDAKN
jgi:hypothetical protein